MNRQSWSASEDQAIIKLVQEYGIQDWTKIASKLREYLGMQKRTGKQCRERWYNHLSPTVNKLPWTDEEEELLFIQHKLYGNRWKDISKFFIGRTDNDIKNHFYSTLRRSLRRLNKIIGEKNSTTQMREIKPSVLSTIMKYIYEQEHAQTQFVQSLKDLPILIFQFAKFKPIKTNLINTNIEMIRQKTSEIFILITRFNDEYQKNKEFRRYMKTEKSSKRLGTLCSLSKKAVSFVKIEQDIQKQQSQIKQNQLLSKQYQLSIKQEEQIQDKSNMVTRATIEKPQFSMNRRQQQQSDNDELTPIGLLNNLEASPKCTLKEVPIHYPSNHRTFFLQADENNNNMNFNEPQQPSRINIEQHSQFQLYNNASDQKQRRNHESQMIDEIIQTHFGR